MDPKRIVFEGRSFVVYYIADLLPKHKNYPYGSHELDKSRSKVIDKVTGELDPNFRKLVTVDSYRTIQNRNITQVIYHQTAGGYHLAIKQVFVEAKFFIDEPEYKWVQKLGKWIWLGNGRGWPGFAYTYYVPYSPVVYRGKSVIYQCNDLNTVSWHTGNGCNSNGVGIAFQGYFESKHIKNFQPMKGTSGIPSDIQLSLAKDIYKDFFSPVFGVMPLGVQTHSMHGKVTCPGDHLEEVVAEIRSEQ